VALPKNRLTVEQLYQGALIPTHEDRQPCGRARGGPRTASRPWSDEQHRPFGRSLPRTAASPSSWVGISAPWYYRR